MAWVQLLSIKTNRAESIIHLVASCLLIIIKLQLGSPAWVTFCWWHAKSPTESSHPHKHAYITLSILPFSHYTHDLLIGTDVFYSHVISLCCRDTCSMMICGCNGGNKNFTGAPLWWMRCCHGNTMVKLPALPPTLTAHLRILRDNCLCALCKIGSWKGGGGLKERVRTWKWYCLELTLKSTILKEMYVLSWQQIHQWVIMLCKVFLFYTATQKSTHTDLGALYDYHTVFTQRHQLSVPLTPSKAASPHPVGMETDKKEERNQTLFFLLNILLTVITVTVSKIWTLTLMLCIICSMEDKR